MVSESRDVATVDKAAAVAPSVTKAEPLVVTREYVDQQKRSLALLQEMVRDVLVEGRDYGKVPGTPQFLWDPGANQIFGGFNVFPGHRRIISHIEDGTKISIVLEVPLIQRHTGAEVGSGVGASSNEETKHKYRWVREDELGLWGYTEDTVASLRFKDEEGGKKYRIPNPDRGELLNVCVKQASKRAEVDGAESLPGVSATLRELFDGKRSSQGKGGARQKAPTTSEDSPKWTKFWGEVRALGIVTKDGLPDRERACTLLGIPNMHTWLSQGKSLDDATRHLAKLVSVPETEGKQQSMME